MPSIPQITIDEFLKNVSQTDGCWPWTAHTDRDGYGRVGRRSFLAHRMSYILFHGSIPDGMIICHTCDNPSCVNPDHLYAGTSLDNMRDMSDRKRFRPRIGELNKRAILTEDDVRAIRKLRSIDALTFPDIASRFGVSTATVAHICSRRNWKHVE